ncbi:Xaa-Pro peptidase family protein [Mammaliicoccus sp. Dog046]|uniref:M24 family metallopeptidase n=1 Tax=Mammaliicoccus sp. Dog046 TaxID=3034233 RepID=UPI002B262CDE|nr:Xaa-Pro peptidase family protein [Mammaliicoccus sp. Dog046]WQK86453.1 Xaa-Pro peptidase family protein [Mammaliicoccus sp. Dog046]
MNHNEITTFLNDNNVDAAWITTPLNIFYLTGYLSEPHERLFSLLITKDGEETLFCPKMEVEEAKNAGFKGNIVGYLDTESAFDLIEQRDYATFAIEAEHLSVKRLREVEQAFNVQQIEDIDQVLKDVRNVKTDEEIELLHEAAKYADLAIQAGVEKLAEGVTEIEVLNHIETTMKQHGISKMSFDTMVLFGDHAAAPHGTPGDRQLKNNEFVLFDLGVIYKGYCSDITRTVAFGTPTDKAKEIYNIVLEANKQAISIIKPGAKISECDKVARDIISNAGFGEYFPHRLGHGLGLSVHEFPDISSANKDEFKPGMVLTVEPGIYVPGVAGVRIEDDIVVTEDGHRILTGYQK